MEQLQQAIARASEDRNAAPSPIPPAPPTQEMRRRAFDGLHRRTPSPAIEQRTREALQQSEARMAAEREAMGRRLGQALGLEPPDVGAIVRATSGPARRAWVPVLFVSSSMPISTLRNYAVQLERAKGVLAFRGMPGGLAKVGPMAKLSAKILRVDPGCEGPACVMRDVQLIVDPLLFRQHGVPRVPALAMVPGDPTQPYCEREEDSPQSSHVIYGDTALSGMLDEYARLGGAEEVRDAQTRLGAR
jgi:type-F conjugative transfer system pilin assembly protein TrbC